MYTINRKKTYHINVLSYILNNEKTVIDIRVLHIYMHANDAFSLY